MKKLLFVCVLGAFAACGTGKTDTSAADSMRAADSLKSLDSAKAKVDTAKMMVDTAKAKVDSIKK